VTFDASIRVTTFDIALRFLRPATVSQRLAFERARERLEQVVVADLPDAWEDLSAQDMAGCGDVAVNETVDDLLIMVDLKWIDGPRGVLGQSGPCQVRPGSLLPDIGYMQFDTADLEYLEGRGQLDEVVLHEMLHVLGFGYWDILWPTLIVGTGTPDPVFTGAQALDAFLNHNGGGLYAGAKIPVENSGEPGTRDVHWRESVFRNELMTGWISGSSQPFSRTTVASLADLGYSVDLLGADPFDLATAALRLGPSAADPEPTESSSPTRSPEGPRRARPDGSPSRAVLFGPSRWTKRL
jgi:hypothetical protein